MRTIMTQTVPDQIGGQAPAKKPRETQERKRFRILDALLPVSTVILIGYFSLATPRFLTFENLQLVALQNSAVLIISVAAALALMAGYVDLSVGSCVAASGVAAGLAFNTLGEIPGILIGLAVGLIVGIINGSLIGLAGLSPLVVTLGMLAVMRGVAVAVAPTGTYGFPPAIVELGAGSVSGISYLVWVAAIVVIVGSFVLNLLPAGKHIIAIGVNSRAAFLNGINVKTTVMWLYVAIGIAAAVAGILTVARLDSAPSATLGLGWEVSVLTAILLGSIPFTGGKGSIWRVVVGVILLGVLRNGITLLNIGPEIADLFSGAVLILAAGIEGLRLYLKKRSK